MFNSSWANLCRQRQVQVAFGTDTLDLNYEWPSIACLAKSLRVRPFAHVSIARFGRHWQAFERHSSKKPPNSHALATKLRYCLAATSYSTVHCSERVAWRFWKYQYFLPSVSRSTARAQKRSCTQEPRDSSQPPTWPSMSTILNRNPTWAPTSSVLPFYFRLSFVSTHSWLAKHKWTLKNTILNLNPKLNFHLKREDKH